MTDFDRARKTMVDNQLRTASVTDRRLLAAMGEVPREKFVPEVRRGLAYIDDTIAVGGGRKLGAPAPFARLLQLAAIQHGDKVLDLGCGTGYSAAVLARLAESVVAVETDVTLAALARATLSEIGANNVTIVEGSIELGGKAHAPYDVIVLEGVVSAVPDVLLALLKPEGRLVALIGKGNKPAVAHIYVRSGQGVAARAEFDAHLPPLAAKRDDSFVF